MTKYRILAVALALAVLTVGFALADTDHPPHRERPTAGVSGVEASAFAAAYSEAAAQAAWIEGEQRAAWFEGVRVAEEAARLEAARQAASVRVATPGAQPSGAGGCGDDWDCFRECTIDHESRTSGGYGAVSPGGTYRGAFQFLASTWRSVAVNAGYGEWADVPVDQVPVAVQDAVARFLWEHSGTRPWGGRCG